MVDAVSIAPAAARGMAAVTAFRDAGQVCETLAAVLGVAPPDGLGFARAADVLLFRLSPSRFFVMATDGDGLVERLQRALDGIAAVTDQSDAWAILAVSGALAHEVLSRVVPLDLNPRRFTPGSVALTRAGAMDVRIWKLSDSVFEVTGARSMFADLDQALRQAARSITT